MTDAEQINEQPTTLEDALKLLLGESFLAIRFEGPSSAHFQIVRNGVSSWQMASAAKTTTAMADVELESWHAGTLGRQAQSRIERPQLVVPRGLKK